MSCARVLLVGGGITSAVTASLLAEAAPSLRLTVWDKARGAGGRMSTARGRTARTQVDTGAQYVSSTPDMFRAHGDIYAALLESGVLAPANTSAIHGMREERLAEGEATRHFVAPEGMSSLVKHFFKLSGAELNFGRRVAEVIKVGGHQDDKYKFNVSPGRGCVAGADRVRTRGRVRRGGAHHARAAAARTLRRRPAADQCRARAAGGAGEGELYLVI